MKTETVRTTCLNPHHSTPVRVLSRGLCDGCYQSARRLVLDGKTSWGELQFDGKALPSRHKVKATAWLLNL